VRRFLSNYFDLLLAFCCEKFTEYTMVEVGAVGWWMTIWQQLMALGIIYYATHIQII